MDKLIRYKYQDEERDSNDINIFEESSLAAKLTQIVDPYEDTTYMYHYDKNSNLYGYDNGDSLASVAVKRINIEDTEYKYGPNKETSQTSKIQYDSDNRVSLTSNFKDIDDRNFEYKHTFENQDLYGRIKSIEGSYTTTEIPHQKTDYFYNGDTNKINKEKTVLSSSGTGSITNDVETTYSVTSNYIEINELISMDRYVADKYGHNIIDIVDGMGKIYKSSIIIRDNLNRIKKEISSTLGTIEYEYLSNTNKLLHVKSDGLIVKEFEYDNQRLIRYKNQNISYDNLGNITQLNDVIIRYNNRNLIESYGDNKYHYNHQGIRFKKETANGYSIYYHDGNKLIAEYIYDLDHKLTKTYHFYYNAIGLAGFEIDGKKYNYLLDSLGNVSKVYFEGRLLGEYNYDAFGSSIINYLFADNEEERQVLRDNPFRWKGYYYDKETGLYQVDGIYYTSELGQFLSPTSMERLNPMSIEFINPFILPANYNNIFPKNSLVPKTINSSDSKNSPWEWYHWLALGVGGAVALTAGVILIAGAAGLMSSGTLLGATSIAAAKGALIGAVTGAATGAISGGITSAITGNSFWNSVGQSAVMGFGIGSLTGAISGGTQGYHGWYKARALEFTNLSTTGSKEVILGLTDDGYNLIANKRYANYFYNSRWDEVRQMTGVGYKGMWKINKLFLKNQIAMGNTAFTLVSNPVALTSQRYLFKELLYITARGFGYLVAF